MTANRQKNGLKGQYILAQGNALGLKSGGKIVRAIKFFKRTLLFRTKRDESQSVLERLDCYSVRKKFFALISMFPRTVFVVFLLPRALPWAELYRPFRPLAFINIK